MWLCLQRVRPWHALVLIRILTTVYLQYGYIHPDEFFQSVETVAGNVFEIDVQTTWEFTPDKPIRSVILTHTLYLPVFAFLKIGSFLNSFQLTSCLVLLAPRLVMLLLSVVIDCIVYDIIRSYRTLDVDSAMLMYASSYITLVFYTRAFSNTMEACLFILLLRCVQKELQRIVRFFCTFPRSKLTQCSRSTSAESLAAFQWVDIHRISQISVCVATGFFNRPTFLLYAYVPLIYFAFDGTLPQSLVVFRSEIKMASRKLWLVVLFSLPLVVLFIGADTVYYKYEGWSRMIETHELPDLTNIPAVMYDFMVKFELQKYFAITPWNFISYNSNVGNLAAHGTHSRLLHFFVNQPLLFGPLFLCVVYDVIVLLVTKGDSLGGRTNALEPRETKFWLHSYVVPLVLLSLFPHQEPRFLIPLLVPLVVLYSHLVFGKKSITVFKVSWIVLNMIGFIVYGYLHQSGVVRSIDYVHHQALHASNARHMYVIYSHTYMPPKHLFLIKNHTVTTNNRFEGSTQNRDAVMGFTSSQRLSLYDHKGDALKQVQDTIEEIYKNYYVDSDQILLIIPSTLETELCTDNALKYRFVFVKQFTGHLSTENLPTWKYLRTWSDRGFPCSLCEKANPCKLHPFHIFSPMFALNIYTVFPK